MTTTSLHESAPRGCQEPRLPRSSVRRTLRVAPRVSTHLRPPAAPVGLPLALGLAIGWAALAAAPRPALPPPADLPADPSLANPLIMFDGSPVKSKRQWFEARRPELARLFQHYMYGPLPPVPARKEFKVVGTYTNFLEGRATLKLVTLSFGDPAAPRIDLMLAIPNRQRRAVPAFLAMNFCGNHALSADPRIPLTRGWVYSSCAGCVDGRATEAGRGSQAADWPIADIIARGYALASFCSSDIDPDRAEVSEGVYAWMAQQQGAPRPPSPHHRGSLAAWAWGFHRCLDYVVTDRQIDRHRVVALGHSRNGKAALLAAAFDPRIALAIPHQAGCGGTAPSRGRTGESVKQINDRFPHWFNAAFKEFNEHPERLPFDQHSLVAMMAPRPVLLSNATEDQWANPAGQFEVLQAAAPVYRFLKAGGLDATRMPEPGHLVDSRLGYFIRAGKHSMTPEDWRAFLAFADKHFRRRR